jgi:hypothetical protein
MKGPQIFLAVSFSAILGLSGCKGGINGDTTSEETAQLQNPAQDPASANLAPVSNASDNTGAPPGAYRHSRPSARGNNSAGADQYSADEQNQDPYADQYSSGDNYGDYGDYDTPVEYAPDPPPPLPDYQQPPAPGDDYMWTPGCWNYDSSQGYYWVPGAWVLAPYTGALWTPGWWGYEHGHYGWHRGFWGRHIGYYGGINYGHGYDGHGYEGGYWQGDHFSYNRTVNNINATVVHNVYNYRITNISNTHVSYNGGRGGMEVKPRPSEIAAYHEQHNPPMSAQQQNVQQARSDRQSFVRVNNGRPAMPVASQPLQADSGVRPPAVLHPQAIRPQPAQPSQPPEEFRNNVHPVPGGSHMAAENPSPQQTQRPEAPRDNHQPAPGRPMIQHPAAPPQFERLAPARPQPAPPAPARPMPQTRQPEPARPVPTPPPARPEPQRAEPQPRPEQRPSPPPEHRSQPAPPAHPAPEKKPDEHRPH